MPNEPGSTYHGQPIPEGYARVMVDQITDEFEDLQLDHPTGEGEIRLGSSLKTPCLWQKELINLPNWMPPPPPPPPSASQGTPPPPPASDQGTQPPSRVRGGTLPPFFACTSAPEQPASSFSASSTRAEETCRRSGCSGASSFSSAS